MLSEALKQIPKSPSASEIYKTGVEAVKQTYQTMLGKVHAEDSDSVGLEETTTDTFAQASIHHLNTVRILEQMKDGLIPAFALMMRVADTCWCDPETTNKMCGYGDSEGPFFELDTQLLGLIYKRHPEMEKQIAGHAANWPAVALRYLKRARDRLADFGVYVYFPQSIAKLEEMTQMT
jgi:hypothetical protein